MDNRAKLKRIGKIVWMVLVYIFAAIGFVLVVAYFAVRFGLTNTTGIIDMQRQSFLGAASSTAADTAPEYANGTPWYSTQEWQVLQAAVLKDAPAINEAAAASGVPARLIVANLIVEQLRLFFTERAFYKQFFQPLQILGSQTQFSWGVMGMKEATAVEVQNNLTNPSSPFYLGPQYANLLAYTSTSTPVATSTASTASSTDGSNEQLFIRLTSSSNHYYSYLYAGLYLKEIETQWQNGGFPISNRPDILSTLYNIGFEHSNPNANPQVGGAAIEINGVTYSFGELALQFYNSNYLPEFPK